MGFGRRTETKSVDLGFGPILLSNLLPIVGIIWFDWRLAEILVIFWLEIWVMLLVYSGLALTAERPVVLEGRRLHLPGVGKNTDLCESKWSSESEGISLVGPIPPIYPRNGRIVALSMFWGAGFLILPVFVFEYYSALKSTVSPAIVGVTIAISASHLLEVQREFLEEKKYQAMSAHMVLEIPIRVIFFAFGFLMTLAIVGGIFIVIIGVTLSETFGYVPSERVIDAVLVTGPILGKLAVEWSRFRAERESNPTGFANWFVPEDPRSK
ncbi:DUF6498-containing protein [Halostagnicola bangensis]